MQQHRLRQRRRQRRVLLGQLGEHSRRQQRGVGLQRGRPRALALQLCAGGAVGGAHVRRRKQRQQPVRALRRLGEPVPDHPGQRGRQAARLCTRLGAAAQRLRPSRARPSRRAVPAKRRRSGRPQGGPGARLDEGAQVRPPQRFALGQAVVHARQRAGRPGGQAA